jgi:hypothetical protein
MTASGDPHPALSPGMPPACGYEVRARFDQLVIRDDFVADLAGNSGHRLLEFQPQVTINTKGQLELHLTVPGPDVWTSLLNRYGRDSAVGLRAQRRPCLRQFRVDNHPHRFWQNAYHESLIPRRCSTGESPSNIQVPGNNSN